MAALVLAVVGVVGWSPSSASAERGCVVSLAGLKVCGKLLGEPLPEIVTVTVRPDPIIVPGPTSTQTITPPPVTVTAPPQPVQTVTVAPRPVTVTPDAVPNETVTVTTTPSASPTRQPEGDDGTIAPDESVGPKAVDFGDGNITIFELGIGLASLLALVGLILLAMYAGYILGYRDKEAKDTRFMRALLDSVKSR